MTHTCSIYIKLIDCCSFQTGKAIGSTFREEVHHFISESDLFGVLQPFYATPSGYAIVNTFLDTVNRTFPLYLDELRGIADGAHVNFTDVSEHESVCYHFSYRRYAQMFLLNVDDEVSLYLEAQANQTRTTVRLGVASLITHVSRAAAHPIVLGHSARRT